MTALLIVTVPVMLRLAVFWIVWLALIVVGTEIVPVPSIVAFAPLSVIALAPPRVPVPFTAKFPATVTAPPIVVVTPVLTTAFPNVIATVGVTVPFPEKVVVDAAFMVNAPRVLVTLLPKVMFAAPLEVKVELPPFFVNGPVKVLVPVETVIAHPLFCAVAAPANVVPPTVSVPAPTVKVINVVATVGCTVRFPVILNAAVPLKVKVIFAPATVGLKVALPAERVTPVAIVIL
jgi:hypothetical protein